MTSGADPAVLLQGLAMFLGETVRPAVSDKATAFRVRIAQHLAMTLAFELSQGEGHDRAALERLSALLGCTESAATAAQAAQLRAALEAELAAQIRDGRPVDDALREHVRQSLQDELAITNPRFDLRMDLP